MLRNNSQKVDKVYGLAMMVKLIQLHLFFMGIAGIADDVVLCKGRDAANQQKHELQPNSFICVRCFNHLP